MIISGDIKFENNKNIQQFMSDPLNHHIYSKDLHIAILEWQRSCTKYVIY